MNKKVTRYIMDVDGEAIPETVINKTELTRHDLVEFLISEASTMNILLTEFKAKTLELVCNYLNSIADQFGEEWKGNATLWNYSRTKSVELTISKQIQFDEQLQVAKTKIYNCIEKWSSGASDNIVILVKKAFDSDKSGFVDTKRILALTTLKFDDEEWNEAITIIRQSIIQTGSKKYINFKTKDAETSALKAITLNYSAV